MEREIVLIIFLGISSVIDYKTKKISIVIACLILGAGMVEEVSRYCQQGNEMQTFWRILLCILPGIVMLILSFCNRGNPGAGDGLMVLSTGVYVGAEGICLMLALAMLSLSVAALFSLVILKKNGKSEVAFIPFLFLGNIGRLIIWYL